MLKSKIKFEKFEKALFSLEAIYLKPIQEDRSNIDATIPRTILVSPIKFFESLVETVSCE